MNMNVDFSDINKIIETLKDAFLWFVAVMFGAGARISYKSQKEKMSKQKIFAVLIMAMAVGFITDNLATHFGYSEIRGAIVALSALFSEGLVNWLYKNEGSIFGDLFRFLLRKTDGSSNSNYRDYETGIKDGSIAESLPEELPEEEIENDKNIDNG